jgi:tRNA (mo5U34)-methyltransferase
MLAGIGSRYPEDSNMSQARNEAVTRATKQQIATLDELGWYHSIELPDGTVIQGLQSIEQLRNRIAQFPIPEDLQGKRVLDIGAWDGWFSFEMERRGAHVVALDAMENPKLKIARDLLNSNIEIRMGDICRISPEEYGLFDIVLFFGVLYHVKHPALALENVCAMTKDLACIESYVTDNGDLDAVPVLEFYEGTELRGQFDNWCGPNCACLVAMSRAAGFASAKLESVIAQRAHVTCRRSWPTQESAGTAPWLIQVENSYSHDQRFFTPQRSVTGDNYVSLWFKSDHPDLTCDTVFVEMGPYAARPAQLVRTGGDGWCADILLPPGIAAGWHEVKLRVPGSAFSNSIEVPVDLEPTASKAAAAHSPTQNLIIELVTDGKTWERWKVKTGLHACVSVWARGIPDDCVVSDLRVKLGETELPAVFLSTTDPEGRKQVNALLPMEMMPSATVVVLVCRNRASAPVPLELI